MGHTSGSAIKSICERARFLVASDKINEDDDYLVRYLLSEAWVETLSLIRLTDQDPILARLNITIVPNIRHYTLPPNVEEVLHLARYDDTGVCLQSIWMPMRGYDPALGGWRLEGRTLVLDVLPTVTQTWSFTFIPNGDSCPHFATDGDLASSTSFVLSAAPSLGNLGKRDSEYLGATLRILGANLHEERIISAYDTATRTATLSHAVTHAVGSSGGVTYEVGPLGMTGLQHAMAARMAEMIGTSRTVSQTKMRFLEVERQKAMKAVRDNLSNIIMAYGKGFEEFTFWSRLAGEGLYPGE